MGGKRAWVIYLKHQRQHIIQKTDKGDLRRLERPPLIQIFENPTL